MSNKLLLLVVVVVIVCVIDRNEALWVYQPHLLK